MERFNSQSPDEKKERGSNGCSSLISMAICIAEVIVGSMYWDDCNLEAARYLYYAGVLGLSVSAISLFFNCCLGLMLCCAACDGKISKGEGCALGAGCCLHWLVQLAVFVTAVVLMIWGFAVIFPAYADWDYTNKMINESAEVLVPNPNYCNYTPFMFAFVLLIFSCVILCLLAPCIICCCCCGAAGAVFTAIGISQPANEV